MLPSSRALLSPLLLLIIAGSTGAFSSRQGECTFPPRWEGTWFQSGVTHPIMISKNELSGKGKCLHNEGDKFLLVNEKSCYRCVVIHEKHSNVLQYKETYCNSRSTLASLCSSITGDALLYSMFREEATPVPCPFRGPMTFSYNRGYGTCSLPVSNVDTCTDDSRLLFRYQACPDILASESAVEELECLATWKEGSSRYLVGRLHHGHASSNEDRYRCFVYEKAGQTVQGNLHRAAMGIGAMDHDVGLQSGPLPEGSAEIYRMAQSGDATCNGLFSPMEGSRTMTLMKVSPPGQCRFPNWLTGHSSGGLTWHTLDLTTSYTFHPRNASLHVTRSNTSSSRFENGLFDGQHVPGQEDQDVKILCNSIKQSNVAQAMTMTMLVAHFTVGCRSGFMCMTFYRRDGHVVEVQTGSTVSRPEEACSPPHFQQHNIPFLTLVRQPMFYILALQNILNRESHRLSRSHRVEVAARETHPPTWNLSIVPPDASSPEPRTCPYLGKFTVTGVNRNQRNIRESRRSQHQEVARRDREKVRHAQERTQERGRKLDFEAEKRRANNEYLVHERMGRRARSNRNNRSHRDHSLEEVSSRRSLDIEDLLWDHSRPKSRRSEEQRTSGDRSKVRRPQERTRRSPKMEDFKVDADDFARIRQLWATDFDDSEDSGILEVQEDYFGDYPDTAYLPKKRSGRNHRQMTYEDLSRTRRDVEEADEDESSEKREKREEDISRCSSEVTTITIGCSTADRMEFQTDCVDDNSIAYSCHGRWYDAEGTQFVIATQLAPGTAWTNENNRPQPYRNSRRLCFMYKESGGVVSLTASEVACQRGIPPPPPMLAFNATSTGQCMEENRGIVIRSTHLLIVVLTAIVAIYR